MNVAVQFHKDNPDKPEGIPDMQPWQVREIGALTTFSEGKTPWVVMSAEEYKAALAIQKTAYDVFYKAALEASAQATPVDGMSDLKKQVETIAARLDAAGIK